MYTPLPVLRVVKRAFDELGVPYLIGGSVASSIYGFPRTTHDVDFVADMKPEQVAPLAAALENECYLDEELMQDAVRLRSMFSVLHLESMHKADVFISQPTAWAQEVLTRRRVQTYQAGDEEESIPVSSAEDMVLQKLLWYRMGGGVSDRQWGDVTGILKVQADALDYAYMQQWAAQLDLTELLRRACEDSGQK